MNKVSGPNRIAVIGGGRWARVITDVLCSLTEPSVAVVVHSPHNAAGMTAWADARGCGDRVSVSTEWSRTLQVPLGAAIVANAARDHEDAVERLLTARVPVMVEKPMALSAAGAGRLIELARKMSVPLVSAHVFLFARYVERFVALVMNAGTPTSVRILWTDPEREERHGELKRPDETLPIVADVLPHILSLVIGLAPEGPDTCTRVVRSAGVDLELDLMVGCLPCHVALSRRGEKRRRVLEAAVNGEVIRLDFSVEPGTIVRGDAMTDADPEWANGRRPLARMLGAFTGWIAGGDYDARLNSDIGLRGCRLIDQSLAWSVNGS